MNTNNIINNKILPFIEWINNYITRINDKIIIRKSKLDFADILFSLCQVNCLDKSFDMVSKTAYLNNYYATTKQAVIIKKNSIDHWHTLT